MNSFIITTDSNSDLPKSYLEAKDIRIISHYYNIDGEDYGEDHLLSDKEFYDRMRAGSMPTTMASNPAEILRVFTKCAEEGKDVLHISFSSGLSCGYNNVSMGAREIEENYPERKIKVVDSLNVSMSQGLLIMQAVEMREAGKSFEEVVEWVEEHKLEYCCQFTVDDLFHLNRGGRLSKTSAVVGSILNIKPILYVDDNGALLALEKTRGRKVSMKKIVDNMIERMGKFYAEDATIGIVHGDCPEDVEILKKMVLEKVPKANLIINTVGPSIGAHSGPGALGLLFKGERR